MHKFKLPPVIADLVAARNRVRDHYNDILGSGGRQVRLNYTLDGNLVGDIGESLAVALFGISLVDSNVHAGIDGYGPDGRTVQVKATGRGLGPAFRPVETRAEHLLFFDLDFDRCNGTVFYNGPEHPVIATLPAQWTGQRCVSLSKLRDLNARVANYERLPMLQSSIPRDPAFSELS
jgi:hypothetical protein